MKRIVAAVITAVMMVTLVACGSDVAKESVSIRVAGLKGPTSIGMVKLMDDAEQEKTEGKYEFTLAGSADEITPLLVKGELDIAAVPANLASVLYNNTKGQIHVLAVNTLGVIYLVENGDTIHSVEDLRGKTIFGSGKGSTPEYSLRYILSKNGINPDKDIKIEWKSEHAEVVAALAAFPEGIGLLPQPFVTVAQGQNDSLRIALDLTEEWNKLDTDSTMITGVLTIRKEFAEKNPEAVKTFLKEYEASVNFINSDIDTASTLTEKYDIIKAPVAKKAIPYCNIVCITGEEMKSELSEYLNVLYDANPASIGGNLPDEDFYE